MIDEASNARLGGLPDGSRPTLQHIAELSGVSVTTISRVLSGQASRYRISKQTENLVRKVAKEFAGGK